MSTSCGTAVAAHALTINPVANPGTISGPATICATQSVSFSETTSGGRWSAGSPTIATVDTTGIVTGVSPGTESISYSVTNSCGTATATYPTTIVPLPVAGPITGTARNICEGATLSVSDTATGGTWSSDMPTIATVTASGMVTGLSTGMAVISYTVTSSCGLSAAALDTVAINSTPGAIVTPIGDTMMCPGDVVLLTANTGTGYVYQWYAGATAISGATDQYYETTTGANYRVVVTNGCVSVSVPMAITVNPATATVSTVSDTVFCSGASAVLNADTGTGYSYQWMQGGVGISGATAQTYNATASGTYDVLVGNAAGCTAISSSIAISVIPAPMATVTTSGALSFCTGDSVILAADTASGLTYQWQNNGINISGATNINFSTTISGNYAVITTNSYPCSSASAMASVTVWPLPATTITATGPTTFCEGSSVLLQATAATGCVYGWFNAGSVIIGSSSATYTAIESGNYSVKVTSATGCTDTTRPPITVHAVTTPVIIPYTTTRFCWGASAFLAVEVAGTGISYQWQDGGVNISGATNNTYTAGGTGNYSCILTVGGRCTLASTAEPVTELPLPNPIISYDSTTLSTETDYISYQWYHNLIPESGGTHATFVPSATGDYTVKVIDTNGCQSISEVYIVRTIGDGRSLLTHQLSTSEAIYIYPNPAHNNLNIAANESVKAVIYAVDGRKIAEQPNATNIDVSQLASGVYIIMLYNKDGALVKVARWVKE